MKKNIAILAGALAIISVFFTSCGEKKSNTVKLGVVGAMYEEIWKPAKEALKAEGIDLQVVLFTDYSTPNTALANNDIDLNAFQHRIFLEADSASRGYNLKIIGNTFIIPLNLYSTKVKSVAELKEGAVVAIPDDVTNGGRALKVLQAAGLVTLNENAGFNPRINDVLTSKVQIKELKANTIPSALPDVDAAIINGNYALSFGIKTESAIFADTSLTEKNYWNLIAANAESLKDSAKVELFRKVVAAFQTAETEKIFNENYGGYFIKVGWDEDELSARLSE